MNDSTTKLPYSDQMRQAIEIMVHAKKYTAEPLSGYVPQQEVFYWHEAATNLFELLKTAEQSNGYVRLTEEDAKKILWSALGAADYTDDVYRDVCRTVEYIVSEKRRTFQAYTPVEHHCHAVEPEPPHPFNPEEVDIGVGLQRGSTCLDCAKTEREGNHGAS